MYSFMMDSGKEKKTEEEITELYQLQDNLEQ